MINVKFLTGSKKDIDNQIEMGVIDSGDVIFTNDTDEIVFLNPQQEKKVMQSRTQDEYVLKGTDLGGLKEGDVISEGTSLDELLKLITTKVIPAEYKQPTITLVGSEDTEYELGSSISALLQSQFIQNDAGALTAHNILKNGEIIYEGGTASPIGASDNFIISDEAVIFESKASYKAGELKNNNLGELSSENAIAAGEIKSEPVVFKGYRKLFYGSGLGEIPEINSQTIRSLSSSKLNPTDGMEFIVDMPTGNQYVMFAYPATLGDVEQITYIQMNDTEMAQNFSETITLVEGMNRYYGIDYKVYSYKTDVPVASKVSFKVKI